MMGNEFWNETPPAPESANVGEQVREMDRLWRKLMESDLRREIVVCADADVLYAAEKRVREDLTNA